jgi:hypothetical protein
MSSRVVLQWEALGDGCNFSLFVETWLGFPLKTLTMLPSHNQETLHSCFHFFYSKNREIVEEKIWTV